MEVVQQIRPSLLVPGVGQELATVGFTVAALAGFAGNSLLCRAALGQQTIDPASFTAVRIGSGALALALLMRAGSGTRSSTVALAAKNKAGSWAGAAALLAYAVCFSFAYTRLNAGAGALILFGAVQVAMIGYGVWSGERPRITEWIGLAMAFGGLILLAAPGVTAVDPIGLLLMAAAGAAWAAYSILGRRSAAPPLGVTAGNFLRAVPLALLLALIAISSAHLTTRGLVLAIASGALASGVGYSFWYAALKGLSSTRAAIVQLSVPVIAAAGGITLLGEHPTLRLGIAGMIIVGGVALAIGAKSLRARR